MPNDLSAGTRVKALDMPPAKFNFNQITQANISSTTYTTGDPETAVWFQAPTSGRVAVTVGAGVRNNSATVDRVFVSFQLYEGSPSTGSLIQSEDAKYGISNSAISDASDDFQYGSMTTMVSGLTPGTFYYARVRHRVTVGGGTADIASRHIMVMPIP